MSAVMAFLAILYTQSAAAQNAVLYAWTDLRQYAPGETGTLYITVRNDLGIDLIIKNITIIYVDWLAYVKNHWEGNKTFTDVNEICEMEGGVYNKEVTFTVPTDGRGVTTDAIVSITTDKDDQLPHPLYDVAEINVVGIPEPRTVVDMDTWMTSLTVVIVICTIILATVVFLSTRRTRAPRLVAPPPPPSPKAKN